MTADICCHITVIRRLTSYNCYQTVLDSYANTGKKFSIAFINNFPEKKRKTLCYGTD